MIQDISRHPCGEAGSLIIRRQHSPDESQAPQSSEMAQQKARGKTCWSRLWLWERNTIWSPGLNVASISDEAVPWPGPAEGSEVRANVPSLGYNVNAFYDTAINSAPPWLAFANSLIMNHLSLGPCSSLRARTSRTLSMHNVIMTSVVTQPARMYLKEAQRFSASLPNSPTGPRELVAPHGNREAWEGRIALAKEKAMSALAAVTASRCFSRRGRRRKTSATCHPRVPLETDIVFGELSGLRPSIISSCFTYGAMCGEVVTSL